MKREGVAYCTKCGKQEVNKLRGTTQKHPSGTQGIICGVCLAQMMGYKKRVQLVRRVRPKLRRGA